MRYFYYFLLMSAALSLFALESVELPGAAGATKMLAADDGTACAIIPSSSETGSPGVGIYPIDVAGHLG